MGRRRLPEFKSERELARFLDDPRVNLSAYDLSTLGEPAEIEVDEESLRQQEETEYGRGGRLRPVTMRLDDNLVRALKQIASRRSISYQTLARMWLRERAIDELRGKARSVWPQAVGEQTRVEQLLLELAEHLRVRASLRTGGSSKAERRGRKATSRRRPNPFAA